jgi:hypothetical protein
MKYALPLLLLASPALAHDGAHMHPHGGEGWVLAMTLALVVAGLTYLLVGRK